jgi:hypothetical protein
MWAANNLRILARAKFGEKQAKINIDAKKKA